MDSVLYKIIEIERAAQAISEEAKSAKRNLIRVIEEEKEKFSVQMDQEINKKLEKFAQQEVEREQVRLEQIEFRKNREITTLRELFANNGLQWEKEIFETIIGKK